jgi:predicted SprT family Zn-dependent metalloprotease
MDLNAARALALELMEHHGLMPYSKELSHLNWKFGWLRTKTTLGLCDFTKETISLSKHYVSLNPESCVRDTILHEIAHAIVGHGHGHDRVWKAKARELGAVPKQGKDQNTTPGYVAGYRWVADCKHCGQRLGRHRLPRGRYSCGKCYRLHPGDATLSWKLNPEMTLAKEAA